MMKSPGALGFLCLAVSLATATVPTVNVRNYGALGNGVADDTVAIKRAIAAIPASGATLYFPCGTYRITSSLSPIRISGVSVIGPTTNCVTLKATGTASLTMLELEGAGLNESQLLTSNTTANTFTVAGGGLAKLGIHTGSYVLVSDAATHSHGPGSPLIANQQMVKVISINGDTATIENGFSTPYTVAAKSYIQKIGSPVVGALISNLVFDATANTGAATLGINLALAVASVIQNVTVKNILGGGIILDWGYNNHLHDVSCVRCGDGGVGTQSVMIRRQSKAAVQNLTITNTATQSVFGFALHETHFSTVSNVVVDAGGSDGRPFKLQRSSHNTLSDVTAKNGGGGHNGISVTDYSTYNTFNNCVALNNTGNGILTFGDRNSHNTFNNCIAKYNTQAQIGQMAAWNGTYTDYYNKIIGGTFCCARAIHSRVVGIVSNYTTLSGATISDDLHLSRNGLTVAASGVTVHNNRFSGNPLGHDIYVTSGLSSSSYSGNVTPDGTTPVGTP